MVKQLGQTIPGGIENEAILQSLDKVLDPELDESILSLGFVRSVDYDNGRVNIEVQLPTYWCAANFSYMMASDIRRELLKVDGVEEVAVRLAGHFASQAIEAGINADKPFVDAFPDEALDNLEQVRDLFLRKGFFKRQEVLLRHLRKTGLSFEQISMLRIEDIHIDGDGCWLGREGPRRARVGPSKIATDYFQRRADLGLSCVPADPLITNPGDGPIPADMLEAYFIQARTSRLAAESNGALCSALLEARSTQSRDWSTNITMKGLGDRNV
jgi:metal-sulfur cluster biosynthetic enzyme